MDISKAFDCIDHNLLLNKLEAYGIHGITLDWFSSYLHLRQQYISINNNNYNHSFIPTGVPQSSILSPLLYIIYVYDLPLVSKKSRFIIYADDTTIIMSHKCLNTLYKLVNIIYSKYLKSIIDSAPINF